MVFRIAWVRGKRVRRPKSLPSARQGPYTLSQSADSPSCCRDRLDD
jgi:hypothetical protein